MAESKTQCAAIRTFLSVDRSASERVDCAEDVVFYVVTHARPPNPRTQIFIDISSSVKALQNSGVVVGDGVMFDNVRKVMSVATRREFMAAKSEHATPDQLAMFWWGELELSTFWEEMVTELGYARAQDGGHI